MYLLVYCEFVLNCCCTNLTHFSCCFNKKKSPQLSTVIHKLVKLNLKKMRWWWDQIKWWSVKTKNRFLHTNFRVQMRLYHKLSWYATWFCLFLGLAYRSVEIFVIRLSSTHHSFYRTFQQISTVFKIIFLWVKALMDFSFLLKNFAEIFYYLCVCSF